MEISKQTGPVSIKIEIAGNEYVNLSAQILQLDLERITERFAYQLAALMFTEALAVIQIDMLEKKLMEVSTEMLVHLDQVKQGKDQMEIIEEYFGLKLPDNYQNHGCINLPDSFKDFINRMDDLPDDPE